MNSVFGDSVNVQSLGQLYYFVVCNKKQKAEKLPSVKIQVLNPYVGIIQIRL